MKKLTDIHLSEVLIEEFLIPLELSAHKLSKEISISQTRISQTIKDNRGITARAALRLSKFLTISLNFDLGFRPTLM